MKIFLTIIIFTGVIFSQNNIENIIVDDLTAHWNFSEPSNLTKAKIGEALELAGTDSATIGPFGASEIGVGSYYIATHGISPNGGGTQVNSYSIVMDIKIPQSQIWYAFYQTNSANTNDADWFLNGDGHMGVGDVGYSSPVFAKDEWYRIAISVSNGNRYDYYIDGEKVLVGTPGSIDGRFALGSKVLFFADQNGEDNTIAVADIKIYSRDLSDSEIESLGGYPHENAQDQIYPYLQSPTSSSIYVCWSSIGTTSPIVQYGRTETLGDSVDATKVYFYDPDVKWYTSKLENLEPSTLYYYKVKTDSAESNIFRFRTQPVDSDSTEHIRIAVHGDNRTYPEKFREVNDSLISKVNSVYGEDLENNINLVFNVGDIVTDGHNLSQYQNEYFEPIKNISPFVPHMVSIGNHEKESSNFYHYMKYEEFGGPQSEKYYSFRIGKVLFIALNTNTDLRNTTQIVWLKNILDTAQNDNSIAWIFVFQHHPGHSELWPDGNTSYVQDEIIPTLTKYSKVDLLTYGHSHNYERGTATGSSNLRLMLSGGGGSNLDYWGRYDNQENYPEIQKSFGHYCYSIIDIDIANKFCNVTTYSLGNPEKPLDNVAIDHFFINKAEQTPPDKVDLIEPKSNAHLDTPFIIQSSNYKGIYDIMSSQFQITNESGNYNNPVINIARDFEDIFGATSSHNPIDLNLGIDLTKYVITEDMLSPNTQHWLRVRYRDKNLQWSEWSDEKTFTVNVPTSLGNDESIRINDYKLYSNYPNPFNPTTTIQFDLIETSIVNLSVYNNLGELVTELENRKMSAGHYSKTFDASNLSSGIYYCVLKANNFLHVRKMTLLK
ncbi:MAG: T9SS type A sorting domain-containing protein [Ignavibacteriae bacterium]|nr:T9SS type A sorting domain-containing protein [Ignavibacteriota bacterium]